MEINKPSAAWRQALKNLVNSNQANVYDLAIETLVVRDGKSVDDALSETLSYGGPEHEQPYRQAAERARRRHAG